MTHTRTRRLVSGGVAAALIAGLFTLIAGGPAQAVACNGYSLTMAISNGALARASSASSATPQVGGTNDATVTVTKPDGTPDNSLTIQFQVTAPGSSGGTVVYNAGPPVADTPGTYTAKITAGTDPGLNTVNAVVISAGPANSCFVSGTITQFGAPTAVSVAFSPKDTVPVSGSTLSQVTMIATVTDVDGRRVNDTTVSFSCCTIIKGSSATKDIFGPPGSAPTPDPTTGNTSASPVNNKDGTYSRTVEVSQSASWQQFAATVSDPLRTAFSNTALLYQYGPLGPMNGTVSLALERSTLVGNGLSSVAALATVRDSLGTKVPGASVSYSRSPDSVSLTFTPNPATTADGNQASPSTGVAETAVRGSTPGNATLFAFSCGAALSCQSTPGRALTVAAAVPTTVTLSISPTSVPADGRTTSTANVSVLDQVGVPMPGATVLIDRTGGSSTQATDQANGTYKALIPASATPGTETLFATATKNGTSKTSAGATLTSTSTSQSSNPTTTPPPQDTSANQGYTLVDAAGGIFTYGTAQFHGSTAGIQLKEPIIGIANKAGGTGYWLVAKDGGVFSFGDAEFYGSLGGAKINAPVLGMEATPTGKGYWLFAADGGIFTYGDAQFYGSTGDLKLTAPAVGMAVNEKGDGYWLVAKDGGIFSFGNVPFHGSTGDRKLNKPVFDMAPTAGDKGYYLVAEDGGVFSFGDAADKFYGSAVGATTNPVIGIGTTPTFNGYWIADNRGGVFPYGDATFLGDRRNATTAPATVGFATVPRR